MTYCGITALYVASHHSHGKNRQQSIMTKMALENSWRKLTRYISSTGELQYWSNMQNFWWNGTVSYYLVWSETHQTMVYKFLNTYSNVIYTRKGLCLSKKMWLSTALLLTMVLTVREVFILGHYDPPRTGRIQQLAYSTNHKDGTTKLHKYLRRVTYGVAKTIQFELTWKKTSQTAYYDDR